MKTIYIGNDKFRSSDLPDQRKDDALTILMTEYSVMESHVIYFSAGEVKIKEILIKKEPYFSA